MFTVGPSSEVYIADRGGEVRLFDPAGQCVRRNDGRLAIMDLDNQRVSFWSPDGDLLSEVSRPAVRPRYGRDAVAFDDSAELWVGLGRSWSNRPVEAHASSG